MRHFRLGPAMSEGRRGERKRKGEKGGVRERDGVAGKREMG